jgi:hypothetical protein
MHGVSILTCARALAQAPPPCPTGSPSWRRAPSHDGLPPRAPCSQRPGCSALLPPCHGSHASRLPAVLQMLVIRCPTCCSFGCRGPPPLLLRPHASQSCACGHPQLLLPPLCGCCAAALARCGAPSAPAPPGASATCARRLAHACRRGHRRRPLLPPAPPLLTRA